MTSSLEDQMRKSLLRSIVQRQIFCTLTGDLLDIRTCIVVLDSDGDPFSVVSPNGFQQMLATGIAPENMLTDGYTFDQSTLPK